MIHTLRAHLLILALAAVGCAVEAAAPEPDAALPTAPDPTAPDPTAPDASALDAGVDVPGPIEDPGAPDAGATPTEPSDEIDAGAAALWGGPCPPPPARCRILPMGDSITFGMRATPEGATSSGGYRRYLRRSLIDAGKAFEYVGGCPGFGGRCRIPPDGEPPYCFGGGAPELGRHDGHPGWDINAFRAREGGSCPGSVETFLSRARDDAGAQITPHIVLLMVGANDVRAGAGIREGAALRFRYLLDELLAALPSSTRVVVGTVTPNLVGTNNADGVLPFNRAVRTIVRARRDAGRNVRLVDTYGAIHIDAAGDSPDLSSDRLHPNERGYQKIARRWYDAIAPLVHAP